MQEGTPAFLRMAGIAAAVRTLTDSGLPYLVYLRNPTTGGVLATWGSLGDVTYAEPGALVGFLGPRVFEGLFGEPFPADVQTAEALAAAGVTDGVATAVQWRSIVIDLLAAWRARPGGAAAPPGWEAPSPQVSTAPSAAAPQRVDPGRDLSGWDAIERTRAADRAGAAELLASAFRGVQYLSGTQTGERANATLLAVATVDELGCVVVAQDRQLQRQRAAQGPGLGLGPADLRVARRGMRLAQRWGLPIVSIIDTQGAEISASAESGALAAEIARCLADLAVLRTPTMSVLIGAGAGGGALALLPADRVIAAHDSWLAALPVEGASLIRFRTIDRVHEIADAQRIRATDLASIGAVDRVVAAAVSDGDAWRAALAEELTHLVAAGAAVIPRTWPHD
jgi:acetyl-CoA carboxylase carboxyl transferase subunit beta